MSDSVKPVNHQASGAGSPAPEAQNLDLHEVVEYRQLRQQVSRYLLLCAGTGAALLGAAGLTAGAVGLPFFLVPCLGVLLALGGRWLVGERLRRLAPRAATRTRRNGAVVYGAVMLVAFVGVSLLLAGDTTARPGADAAFDAATLGVGVGAAFGLFVAASLLGYSTAD